MRKWLSMAAVAAVVGFVGTAEVQAMPMSPLQQAQDGLMQQVRGGCGAGWHRGPYGGCRRNTAPYGPRGRNACWFQNGYKVCR